MIPRILARTSLLVPALLIAACGSGSSSSGTTGSTSTGGSATTGTGGSTGGTGGTGGTPDPAGFAYPQPSCIYNCPLDCPETTTPYSCQNLLPWNQVPHADTCEKWDGNFPAIVTGKCTATDPTGEALKFGGPDPDDANTVILPDGRRLAPAGTDFVFPDPQDMVANVVPVAGTGFVLVVDTGNGDHLVRVVDPSKIGSATSPTVSQVNFQDPQSLNRGIVFSPPDRVFVASAQGVVQALTIDTATGQLARDDARSITLPPSPKSPNGTFYGSGVARSADNTRLFASGVKDSRFFVADITAGGPDYGKVLGQVDLGAIESFNLFVDANDPTTHFVYATIWASHQVVEIDVSDPTAPKVARSFQVEKDPEGIAFLDARWMVVGNDLGDTLSIIDRVSATVTTIPVDKATTLRGAEPGSLAYDAATKRLYATEGGLNAVAAFDVDLAKTPPTIAPAGRLPTQWWPSGIVVAPSGDLVVTSLMARGQGPKMPGQEYELLHGGIQRIPAPSAAALAAGEVFVTKSNQVAKQPGYSQVQCPAGADDFPIPATNTGKPSPVIEHVILVVRENKGFDALFGDFPGVKGKPDYTFIPSAQMDGIWGNIRSLARTFAHSDNYYTAAFLSTQGHLWATHGRTDDFNEREWSVTGYGRGLRGDPDSGGVADVARPAEGSMFDWLDQNQVPYDILGEIVGIPTNPSGDHPPNDHSYPGGFIQSIGYPDIEKACYVAGRAKVRCDLGKVTYMTLPNDHTRGVSSSAPSPQTMYAVNDEATGMLIDGISHSAMWKNTLVMVVEDDPAGGGGESVDYHRTIFVAASPWVKRKYVGHSHMDMASIHKLIAHILAIPYPNLQAANAPLPFEMFTSTPDYTPFTYAPRTFPAACGTNVTSAEQQLNDSWDMDEPDEQPGLEQQVRRYLEGKQLTELTPQMQAEIARRIELRDHRRAGRGARD